MGLIIKRSMEAFWNTKDVHQLLAAFAADFNGARLLPTDDPPYASFFRK